MSKALCVPGRTGSLEGRLDSSNNTIIQIITICIAESSTGHAVLHRYIAFHPEHILSITCEIVSYSFALMIIIVFPGGIYY